MTYTFTGSRRVRLKSGKVVRPGDVVSLTPTEAKELGAEAVKFGFGRKYTKGNVPPFKETVGVKN